MKYREYIEGIRGFCKKCNGRGFITYDDGLRAWRKICIDCKGNGDYMPKRIQIRSNL